MRRLWAGLEDAHCHLTLVTGASEASGWGPLMVLSPTLWGEGAADMALGTPPLFLAWSEGGQRGGCGGRNSDSPPPAQMSTFRSREPVNMSPYVAKGPVSVIG